MGYLAPGHALDVPVRRMAAGGRCFFAVDRCRHRAMAARETFGMVYLALWSIAAVGHRPIIEAASIGSEYALLIVY